MVRKSYDYVVLGGGSAGYASARTAAALGKRVAIVDGAKELGGLCILKGCMPSKTLLHATDLLHAARTAGKFGLRIDNAAVDMKALQRWKKKIIREFADYRVEELKSKKYHLYRSHARFLHPQAVELTDGTVLESEHFIISTGSRVSIPPIPGLAETPFWTSDDVLDLDFIPESVLVLGGGTVACELAQFLRRIGAKVTLLQRSERLLRGYSAEAASVVEEAFREEGIEIHTGTAITAVSRSKRGVMVKFKKGAKTLTRQAAYLFNALGREPNTAGLDLKNAGVKLTEGGRIQTNRWQQTSARHIYAGGDVCGPHDIVHLAVSQGELAANHAFGAAARPIDPAHFLGVVFTSPPLAVLGLSEKDLSDQGVDFIHACYPFNDHGKSILMAAGRGFVKILADRKTGRLLGAEIAGVQAESLIHCLTGPLAMKATARQLLAAPWYHPTLAEILTYPLEELAGQFGR